MTTATTMLPSYALPSHAYRHHNGQKMETSLTNLGPHHPRFRNRNHHRCQTITLIFCPVMKHDSLHMQFYDCWHGYPGDAAMKVWCFIYVDSNDGLRLWCQ